MLRIVSDSTCDLSPELTRRYHIDIVPLYIELDGREFLDGVNITPDEIYLWSDAHKSTPRTAAIALESVEKHLETEFGIVLNQPAYTKYHVELGEISSYPPGYKENAGIFCHNNPWIACAETVLGHGNRAFSVFKKTCPVYLEEISEIHRTEPYAYCQMVAGRDAPTHGEGKNSWLTGTAAWTFTCMSQYILGIQPTLEGLKIDPCIPDTLKGFHCDRKYRGVTYHIDVDNSAGAQKGIASITVDGKPVESNVILPPEGAAEVQVNVVLG